MGDDKPAAPAAPDYAAANREGVMADIETLPQRLRTQQEAELGLGQFKGLGQSARLQQQLDMFAKSAPQIAQQQLDLEKNLGPQRIAMARQELQQADPNRFALSEAFNKKALEDLSLGDQLSADQMRNVQQNTRMAQTARGNIMGDNPSIQEALSQFDYGQRLKSQRQGLAAQALGLGGANNQFGSIQGAQQGATTYNPMSASLPFGINQNAGAQAAQFAQQSYGTSSQNWATQMNQQDPWMQMAGMAIGAGSSLGGAAMMCWVAREVFGDRNPKWIQFRSFVINKSEKWFKNYYLERGERIAGFLKMNPEFKQGVQDYMEERLLA